MSAQHASWNSQSGDLRNDTIERDGLIMEVDSWWCKDSKNAHAIVKTTSDTIARGDFDAATLGEYVALHDKIVHVVKTFVTDLDALLKEKE